jgi:RNA polymerase sigma factor (sigma-70 family)
VAVTSEVLERLYRERYVQFRNGLAPVVGSFDEARDVVQEAFARALRSLQARVWRIALRAALERRRRGPETGSELAELPEMLDPQLVERERDQELDDALRLLPPRQRLVVFLRYFADLSYAEIADVAGISEGTVGAMLSQARAALMEQLEMEGAAR